MSGTNRCVVEVRGPFGYEHLVVVSETSIESAKSTFENDFGVFEVGITTIPHNGETTETVFSRSRDAAKEIAVGRKGEYSDVPRFVDELNMDAQAVSAESFEATESLEADHAADEHRIEQYSTDIEQEEA